MSGPGETDSGIAVNGVAISEQAIAREMQHHPAGSGEAAYRAAARALIVREALLQRAAHLGIAPTPQPAEGTEQRETEEEATIRGLLEREIEVPEPDEASCRRYYAQNPQRFRSADLFEAAHILYAARQDDEAAYAEAVRRAEDAIARLTREPARFAEIARSESACTSGKDGGYLGQLRRGDTVPEFETFLCNLEPGQLCPVAVKTRYGAHVLRLDRRIEGRQLPFELVEAKIADYLRDAVWRRAVHQYIELLLGQSEVTGIELGATGSPLVQ